MIYKHFSSRETIKIIYDTKKLWLTKLIECKGQKDFCLTEDMFFNMLSNLDYSQIQYSPYFPMDKFSEMCKCKRINDKYKFYENKLYGACITIDGNNEQFRDKYGKYHIDFDLEAVKKKNTDFLMIYDVVYSLEGIEQYVYDLSKILYLKGEYQTRYALELSDKDLPDNYEDMVSRLFYYMKVLYKLPEFEFEHETRIVVDANKLNTGVTESFVGEGYHYTHNILKMIYGTHLEEHKDKYILLLGSFPEINLKNNI